MSATVVTVLRTTASEHFTIMPNDLLRGRLPRPLHVMARCVLDHLLSLPPGWKMTRAQLDEGFVEGEAAVTSGLKELRQQGYLVQERRRTSGGTYAWSWHVTDDPETRPLTPEAAIDYPGAGPASGPDPDAASDEERPPSPDEPGMVGPGMVDPGPEAPSPDSPGMVDHPMVEGGIREEDGSRRLGKDAPTLSTQPDDPDDEPDELALVPLSAVPSEPAVKKPPTVDQRANALATVYFELVDKMASFPGTRGIVKRALTAGHPDDRIEAALRRLAGRKVTPTLNTLREELATPGRGGSRASRRPSPSERAARVLAMSDEPEAAQT